MKSNLAYNYNIKLTLLQEWDEELAKIAQRWADQCKKTVDQCRNTGNVAFNLIF